MSYNEDIRPIFNKKCIVCHGGVKKNGGFSLLFPEEAFVKAKSGKVAIIPFDADDSELVKRLKTHDLEKRMPKNNQPLSDEEIEKIEDWIDQGAKWEAHWAYSKPNSSITPPEVGQQWAINGIDKFILSKAHHTLSLSEMTFSHQMIRLFFTEQLYRGFSILKNEKYHHE